MKHDGAHRTCQERLRTPGTLSYDSPDWKFLLAQVMGPTAALSIQENLDSSVPRTTSPALLQTPATNRSASRSTWAVCCLGSCALVGAIAQWSLPGSRPPPQPPTSPAAPQLPAAPQACLVVSQAPARSPNLPRGGAGGS